MDKQHAHRLLDQLDPGQLAAVGQLLEVMLEERAGDLVAHALATALPDDESVSNEDRRRFQSRHRQQIVSMDDVLADFR